MHKGNVCTPTRSITSTTSVRTVNCSWAAAPYRGASASSANLTETCAGKTGDTRVDLNSRTERTVIHLVRSCACCALKLPRNISRAPMRIADCLRDLCGWRALAHVQ